MRTGRAFPPEYVEPVRQRATPCILGADDVLATIGGRKTHHLVPERGDGRQPWHPTPEGYKGIAVRRNGEEAACRVIILSVQLIKLGDLTPRQRHGLGLKRLSTARWWIEQHDPEWLALDRDDLTELDLDRRWRFYWATRVAWLIEWKRDDAHLNRWMHRDATHGYTSSEADRMRGEPEAVPSSYQDTLSIEGRKRHAERAHTKGTPESRMRELRRRAELLGVDISNDERVIEDRLAKIEQRLAA